MPRHHGRNRDSPQACPAPSRRAASPRRRRPALAAEGLAGAPFSPVFGEVELFAGSPKVAGRTLLSDALLTRRTHPKIVVPS